MTWTSYGAYLLIVVGLVLMPGPDTFVLLRSSLAGGRRSGLLTATGIVAGNLIQGSLAAFGLGVLIAQSHTAFTVIRWAGVVYLGVLGIQALIAARRGTYTDVPEGGVRVSARRALLTGFASNVTNPKVMIMYLSVLPQFLVPGVTTTGDALLLAVSVAVLGGLYQLVIITVVHRARDFFARRTVRRAGDTVAGVALLGFGAALAAG